MVSGFFLGGAAEGMNNAAELGIKKDKLAQDLALQTRNLDLQEKGLGLKERELGQDLSLRTRALDLQAQSQRNAEARNVLTMADKQVSDTLAVVTETIKAGLAANKDPQAISKAVQPLIDSAKGIATKAGRDPGSIDAYVAASFATPTGVEASKATGTNKASQILAENKVLSEGGVVKTDKDRAQLENALRDDYTKAATDFIKIRDAKNRIEAVKDTGAGDVALVFQYMKILDPGSTVREGEFATASNAAGVPASVIAQYNKIVGGGVLAPQARKEIKDQAKGLYEAQATQFKQTTESYRGIAKRQGLDEKNVIIDLEPTSKVREPNSKTGIPAPPAGFEIVK